MKYILLLSFLSLIHFSIEEKEIIIDHEFTIEVSDLDDNPLIGVNVRISKDGKLLKEVITDLDGRAAIVLEEGYYTFILNYNGYKEMVETGLKISKSDSILKFKMFPSEELGEIVISGFGITKVKRSYDVSSPEITSASPSTSIRLRGYTSVPAAAGKESDLPGSGKVTAGEWNDLNNWNDWKKLIDQKQYQHMQSHWGINTNERYAVVVVNESNKPIPGAKVTLVGMRGKELWRSYTDISGKAELWHNAFDSQTEASRIVVTYEGDNKVLRQIRTIDQGAMVTTIDQSCPEDIIMDISFVVDATSSMSDEIRYLQSELLNVIDRVKNQHHDIRWSSVFYRDRSDDYLTKEQPFHSDPIKVLDFIKSQDAAGGGDFPEAVSDAMDVVVNSLEWRDDSNVKLCFLLLDAPPHTDEESMSKFRRYLKQASSMGIKIIPITASGIDRETEFLMKFAAMLTNGTYVFITDDSGIGNPHLDPVVKDYEVEKLNDLMVRLITSYSRLQECGQDQSQFLTSALKYYPNPATNFLNVENENTGGQLFVLSASGKIVGRHQLNGGGTLRIDLGDLISGSYILRWVQDNQEFKDYPFLIIK